MRLLAFSCVSRVRSVENIFSSYPVLSVSSSKSCFSETQCFPYLSAISRINK